MSFKVKDHRTGETLTRKRPIVTVSISDALLKEIDSYVKPANMSRSEIIERCILYGLDKFKENHLKAEKPKQEVKKEESVEERFMKEVLFERSMDDMWVSV
jgi:metal-responsive CopG/Arc/MetJ family transcriptional regulator